MARRSKVVFCLLLAFLYVVVNIYPLRAEALPDVMSGGTTLADNIMSYYAMSGSAVANTDWINTLYDSYGTSFGTIEELAEQGYLVMNDSGVWESTQQLGEMIADAPAYASLELNNMFNISAEEAASGGGYAAASGASVLAGSLGGVATNGVLPLFGGVTAAYWGGIAIGTLCNHLIDRYKENIAKNANMMASQKALQNVPSGGRLLYASNRFQNNKQDIYYCCQSGVYGAGFYNQDGSFSCYLFNADNVQRSYLLINMNNPNGRSYNLSTDVVRLVAQSTLGHSGWAVVSNQDAVNAYASGLRDGSIERPRNYSPDIIGENGNQEANTENGGITVPDIKPMIDPQTQAGKPLTLQDWLNFANGVKNNNSSSDPFGNNSSLYQDILDLVIPSTGGDPNPDPDPDPWSPPVITPVPDPEYPDPVPDQELTENPQESENPQQTENPVDTGKPWKLPDLRNKFPFCIPWDIAKIFSKLKVNARQAPHISWRFNPPNTPIDYTFNLDLEDFESVAALLRTLELMGFIVGLAFVTRYLIGAN